MRNAAILGAVGALIIGATAAWKIQHDMREGEEALLARAAVSAEQARETALAAYPGATIVESEIEEENGRLIYSFDLEVPGQPGKAEVEIDAMTGERLPPDADDDDDRDDDDEDDDGRG